MSWGRGKGEREGVGGAVCLLAAAQQVIFLPHKSQNMQIKQARCCCAAVIVAGRRQGGERWGEGNVVGVEGEGGWG